MDEGLKNRVIKILEDEQNQLDGVYDPQSDVSAPSKVTNVTVTPNDDGTWNKTEKEEDSGLYDQSVVGKVEQQLEDDAQTLQEFCAILDNQIISFNAQINTLKEQVITLSTEAIARNCWAGIAYSTTTSGGITTNTGIGSTTQNFGNDFSYQEDRDGLKIFQKMAGPNQDLSADNPFDPDDTVTLSASYSGYGYENERQDDGGSVVGTARTNVSLTASDHSGPRNVGAFRAYAGVGTAPYATDTSLTGTAGQNRCVAIASSITSLLSQIDTLRAQREAAVSRTNLNSIKSSKKEKELQNWGSKNLRKKVEARKTKNSSAISAVNNIS